MNIVGVVVLFYPNEEVIKNIRTYYNKLDLLFVIDNTPIESNINLKKYFNNIIYLHQGSNEGIAFSYNLALKKAQELEYEYLLIMDQDSSFEEEIFQKYLKCIKCNKKEKISIYSVNHLKKKNPLECKYEINKIVMSSGNIIKVNHLIKIGGFDEKLFIDEVDHDICIRIMLNGYNIIYFNNLFINHNLGYVINIKNKKIRTYSSKRLYYIVRNYLYVRNKFKKYSLEFFNERDKFMRKFIFYNFLFSKSKLKVIFYLIKALKDYLFNKMGKRVEI